MLRKHPTPRSTLVKILFLFLLWKLYADFENVFVAQFLNECLVQGEFPSRFLRNYMLLIHLYMLLHHGCGMPPQVESMCGLLSDSEPESSVCLPMGLKTPF